MGQAPQEQGPRKAGTPLPWGWEKGTQLCKEVAVAHAGPSSPEEPPPACVQPLVKRSGSLPPAACLAAVLSNFLCIVPTTAATVPCTSLRAPHSQAPRALPHHPATVPTYISAHFTDTYSHSSCYVKVSAGCSHPQRNIPAWRGGSIHGKGSNSKYWGVPCSPTHGKSLCWVLVAWAGGCGVQGPLCMCTPYAECVYPWHVML